MQPITVIFTVAEDSLAQVLAQTRGMASTERSMPSIGLSRPRSRTGKLLTHRQPDRYHYRHGEDAGALRKQERRAVPQPVREHQAAGQHLQGVTLIPTSAIQHNGQTAFVYVIQNGTAQIATSNPVSRMPDRPRSKASIQETSWPTAASKSCKTIRRSQFPNSLRPAGCQPRASSVSPSRPFILRPVATSLLMAAILLVGIVAYTQLPVSALPEVDYPTIQVAHFLSGRQPGRHGDHRDRAAGTAVWPDAGAEPDDLHQFGRNLGHRAAVQLEPRISTLPKRKCSRPSMRRRVICPPTCRRRRSTARRIRPTRRC